MSFNTIIDWNSCTAEQQRQLLMRPAISASESITRTVNDILDNVKARGDEALREYSAKFDKTTVTALKVSAEEIAAASERLSDELKQAMAVAVKNIETFHTAQKLPPVDVETQPGVRCQQVTRPVASVGLYIPGGSAPLFSTVLMLATPASIAGCKKVVLCSPPPIADEILYAAQLCGVQDVFNVGGAQAIAALAFGTESVPKVDKIFGPGNAFVTEAKRQVSQRLDGAAIDMPAGPSEVLVIADSGATPDFVASDLLSQAEHGPDSQVILLTPAADMARRVAEAVERQLAELPRAETARQALNASRLIVTKDLAQCVEISNQYGPEHLIIQTRNARELVDSITSAGSVFLGDWSPESAGDYASGTNHVLPTYGYTATCSSLGLADFGPGNAFVTEAKRQVSQRLDGAAIDMPAGPSEVLVIADSGATPDFVASDLLSQAEHGPDSQVILLTPAADMARRVAEAVERQLAELPRAETARQALNASRLIVTKDLAQCVEISNQYGPEHLIIQTRNARELVDSITSAGSVFLGDWSPESAGDYASGTNHVLPTYGYTATCSSLGLADFQKRMTVQELSKEGFSALASTIETLAAAERLTAHKNAVTLRVNALKEQA